MYVQSRLTGIWYSAFGQCLFSDQQEEWGYTGCKGEIPQSRGEGRGCKKRVRGKSDLHLGSCTAMKRLRFVCCFLSFCLNQMHREKPLHIHIQAAVQSNVDSK